MNINGNHKREDGVSLTPQCEWDIWGMVQNVVG